MHIACKLFKYVNHLVVNTGCPPFFTFQFYIEASPRYLILLVAIFCKNLCVRVEKWIVQIGILRLGQLAWHLVADMLSSQTSNFYVIMFCVYQQTVTKCSAHSNLAYIFTFAWMAYMIKTYDFVYVSILSLKIFV